VSKDLNSVALEAFRQRIVTNLPGQIRHCVEELSDEQIWWRGNDESNSIGNLVLHVSGSIRHYLCRGIGGFAYDRDRPAEFAERGPMPRQRLLSIFDETIDIARQTLESFDASRLTEASGEPGYQPTLFDQILGVVLHLTIHTGQIVYATKMLKEGSVNELWIKAMKKP
jgi:uncharacterized damage-inducible protein DinB